MADIKIVTAEDLKQSIQLDLDAIACIEHALAALAKKTVIMPPILRLDITEQNAEVDVKTAYVPTLDSFAIKISPGFFNNPQLGLPSLNGLMALFSAKTGLVEAVLLDNGYLTAIRTAAAGAIAAKHLSREDATAVTIMGTGEQAELQLEALTLVRPIRTACYWGKSLRNAKAVAAKMSAKLGLEVQAEADAQKAVSQADIIVTCTPATEPILQANWLSEGQHVTAMGSDAEHKNELDPEIISTADIYAPDSLSQVRQLGELHHAIEAGMVHNSTQFNELGLIISGQDFGRTDDKQITVVDLTGTGVQDTAIATLAYSRILAIGKGFNINN